MRRNAFTIVELLVVIAIIGILAALLFPALQYSKELARRATCRNNLQQIGRASNTYAVQWKDYFPPGTFEWGHDIWDYGRVTNIGVLLKTELIEKPSSSNHIFYCPSMDSSASPEGWFMFGYPPNRLGFQNYDRGSITNIGYEYRDSYDNHQRPPNGHALGYNDPGDIASAWTDKAMNSDIFTRLYGQYCHKIVYNVLYGDGAVLQYTDKDRKVEQDPYARDSGCYEDGPDPHGLGGRQPRPGVFTNVFDKYYREQAH